MGCSIAIVDDNNIFCFLFEKLIKKYKNENLEVLTFNDGQKALDYLLLNKDCPENLPQVIFVDINMPLVTGWELLDLLKINNHKMLNHTPFFIVSSSDNEMDVNKSKEYSFVKGYLKKPLDKSRLYAILEAYLP